MNTHFHADHTGGNAAIRKAGVTITGANVAGNLTDATEGAQIIAHENVLNRMSAPTGVQSPTPVGAWPTDTYTSGQKELFFNDEPIQIIYQPAAHTDGDSLVFFRHSDVVSTGDVFTTATSYPFLDLEHGGGIQGETDALNQILYLTIPKYEEEGGTYGDSRSWANLRRVRRSRISRHGDDYSRPRAGRDQGRQDAGAGESGSPDGGLRRAVRLSPIASSAVYKSLK